MSIKNTIQHYISVYSGSKKRVINSTIQERKCKTVDVESNIDWLIKKDYIKRVSYSEMTDSEKTYYNSDLCEILRNIKIYDEIEYYKEQSKAYKEDEKLSNFEKFNQYFTRMENEFDRKNLTNGKNYLLEINDELATIKIVDENREITIDFNNTSNWTYNEANNSIFYKKENSYFTIKLFYLWGKCCIEHYNSY